MKSRNGFVSNSSSSSFIVAFNSIDKDKLFDIIGIKKDSIAEKIFSDFSHELYKVSEPCEEDDIIKNWFYYDENDERKKEVEKAFEEYENVCEFEIDYHNNTIFEKLLKNYIFRDEKICKELGIKVLLDCN